MPRSSICNCIFYKLDFLICKRLTYVVKNATYYLFNLIRKKSLAMNVENLCDQKNNVTTFYYAIKNNLLTNIAKQSKKMKTSVSKKRFRFFQKKDVVYYENLRNKTIFLQKTLPVKKINSFPTKSPY